MRIALFKMVKMFKPYLRSCDDWDVPVCCYPFWMLHWTCTWHIWLL